MWWRIEIVRVGKRVYDIWARKGRSLAEFRFTVTERFFSDDKLCVMKPAEMDEQDIVLYDDLRSVMHAIVDSVLPESESAAA